MSWHNPVIQPLLTDFYQITMAYSYWKNGKKDEIAVFDLYFRKNPFGGEFTIFAGLSACLDFLNNWKISDEDIEYLKKNLPPTTEEEFFTFLKTIDPGSVELWAVPEGSIVFPKVPLIRVEGPLPVVQLLETTLLNLVNFASLVATNAARFRLAAGMEKVLLEFGLRRAQGPDGGLSASKYCYLGGFDGTSNVLAGKLYDIPVKGTMAHAFVSSFTSIDEGRVGTLKHFKNGEAKELYPIARAWLKKVAPLLSVLEQEVNSGELVAFSAYAAAFPGSFLALVDTYHVLRSGVPCYCAVALALNDFGYRASGMRLDSGDLAYLSIEVRKKLKIVAEKLDAPWIAKSLIVASNDINEDTLLSLKQQGHSIDAFGIGTHLVTCQKQPALGCVFKLVELNKRACMKLSQDIEKITIPSKKVVYRLYGADGSPLLDLLQRTDEAVPALGGRVLCRHAFDEGKRAYVLPSKVETLLRPYWKDSKICQSLPTLKEIQTNLREDLQRLRPDHIRPLNPTPYKVALSGELYTFMHHLWLENMPIGELA
ncbi:nicotinate phosphoribosyltransferase [Nematostella vectensis]|uniref:nicotinate phosphoribosyltransferase n=1 Tax=Nematostella vectensis TaxID=45351 RepID=UPI001390444A|nr:nicotinate phosphoribosyltransferase [Nematostella vectensis]